MHASANDRRSFRPQQSQARIERLGLARALQLLALALLLLPAPAAAKPSASWLARAREHIAAREYHATRSQDALQAPNRAHGLRTWFEPTGVRVVDRVAPGSPSLVEMSLVRVGRPGSPTAVPPGTVWHEAARVEIRRPGLVEWYLNSPAGLEQGVTLTKRPQGEGDLVLEFVVAGARVSGTAERLRLRTEAGRRLAFGGLRVDDAAGRQLPASFVVDRDGYRVVVEDHGAVYPVVVDPLLTEGFDAEIESNQVNARLGTAVAGAGDVNGDGFADVIVGASRFDNGETDEGAAFVFLGSATGLADGNPLNAHALIESNQADAFLGASVDSAGDVNGDGYADVIVGAGRYDNGEVDEGVALIFHGSAAGIADGDPTTANTLIESDQAGANLGGPRGTGDGGVAGVGDANGDGYGDVFVGATGWDETLTDQGRVFVFAGSPSGVPSGGPSASIGGRTVNQANAYLGVVAGAGDVNGDGLADFIACAGGYDGGQTNEGVAIVFPGRSVGPIGPFFSTIESDEAEGIFDASIACSGAGDVNGDGYSDVVVGFDLNDSVQPNAGLVLVVHGSATGIANTTPTNADSVLSLFDAFASLGRDVGPAGDVNGDGYGDLIVGAPGHDDTLTDEGAAWVLLGSASGIPSGDVTTTAWAQLPGGQAGAEAGSSVASAGDVDGDGYDDVLVGAPLYDGPQTSEGQAFLYRGGAIGIQDGNPLTADTQLESDQANAKFGGSVASAGDVNGDGYGDVIVGARLYDSGETNEGAAFVFLGSAAGIPDAGPTGVHAQIESDQSGAELGYSASSAGDVNGDGYGDVIVGAIGYDSGETSEGAAFVFLGSALGMPDGDPASAHARLESDQAYTRFGWSVASAGDVNGDSYADVVVGAPRYAPGMLAEGAVFVFLGSATGIASAGAAGAQAMIVGGDVSANFGTSVASAGDVDGDGFGDLIVGAPFYSAGESSEGAAFVFRGSAAGIVDSGVGSAHAQLESNQPNAYFGRNVASAGDVNADGYSDVIVGCESCTDTITGEGAAFIFHGGAAGIASAAGSGADTRLHGGQLGVEFGYDVATAGDVNGDGYSDVIVSAERYDDGEFDEGAAFVFLGGETGIADDVASNADAIVQSDQANARLGGGPFLPGAVASAGDVNGDGFGDVIVGAGAYDVASADDGAAWIFLGNGSGRPLRAQQVRDDGTDTPIEPWGRSGSATSFRAQLTAPTSPRGRERGKLEIEACPAGVAFEDPACVIHVSPTWEDLAAPVLFDEAVTGLTEFELYHWRARILYIPFTGDLAGVTPPQNPRHGPWYRPSAQSVSADVRVVPEPGAIGLVAGGLGLAALGRRRGGAAGD